MIFIFYDFWILVKFVFMFECVFVCMYVGLCMYVLMMCLFCMCCQRGVIIINKQNRYIYLIFIKVHVHRACYRYVCNLVAIYRERWRRSFWRSWSWLVVWHPVTLWHSDAYLTRPRSTRYQPANFPGASMNLNSGNQLHLVKIMWSDSWLSKV